MPFSRVLVLLTIVCGTEKIFYIRLKSFSKNKLKSENAVVRVYVHPGYGLLSLLDS